MFLFALVIVPTIINIRAMLYLSHKLSIKRNIKTMKKKKKHRFYLSIMTLKSGNTTPNDRATSFRSKEIQWKTPIDCNTSWCEFAKNINQHSRDRFATIFPEDWGAHSRAGSQLSRCITSLYPWCCLSFFSVGPSPHLLDSTHLYYT